ncbi:MAG TPA: hypothetical protein VIH86_14265 [Puia sp.]
MIRFKIFIAALLFASAFNAKAQSESSFVLSKTIQADIVDFTVDNLGNIYLLSKDNQLKKLDANGDSAAVYNAVTKYGNVYFIDVTNPLKILLYYKDFATIIAVDRFLNVINTIDLRSLNIFQVKAIGVSYDNNVWIFDELDANLKRIGVDGSLIDQTTDFRQLFDTIPDPSTIIDQNGLVYLYDTAHGVYIFDHYGALKNHIQLKNWLDFTVIDKNLMGRNENFFLKYQLGTLNIEQQAMSNAYRNAIKIKIMPASIYVLKKNILQIYTRP